MWGGHKTRWWFNNHDEGGKRRNYLLKNVLRILFWCSSFLRILTNRAGGSQAVAKFTKVVVFVFHSPLLRTVEFAAFLFSCRSKRLLQPRIMVRFRRETGIKKKSFCSRILLWLFGINRHRPPHHASFIASQIWWGFVNSILLIKSDVI